jgi:CheY-like chemotaxis protein
MPNKDGFEVLEVLSKDPNLQSIPVLVFSTLGTEQDVEKAKRLGAVDYVNKSFFDFDNLLAKIQTILQHKEPSDQTPPPQN